MCQTEMGIFFHGLYASFLTLNWKKTFNLYPCVFEFLYPKSKITHTSAENPLSLIITLTHTSFYTSSSHALPKFTFISLPLVFSLTTITHPVNSAERKLRLKKKIVWRLLVRPFVRFRFLSSTVDCELWFNLNSRIKDEKKKHVLKKKSAAIKPNNIRFNIKPSELPQAVLYINTRNIQTNSTHQNIFNTSFSFLLSIFSLSRPIEEDTTKLIQIHDRAALFSGQKAQQKGKIKTYKICSMLCLRMSIIRNICYGRHRRKHHKYELRS